MNSPLPLFRNAPLAVARALLLASFLILYRPVIIKLVTDWWTDTYYLHGFLVIPIALYFVWERRDRLRDALRKPSVQGLFVVLASVATLIAGILGAELFLTRISLVGLAAGTVLFVFGWQHLRRLAFPLAFLILMIPIPTIAFNQVAWPLQLLASQLGVSALQMCAIPVLREGSLIELANTTLEIAEACSDIRSMVSLLTMGIVYGYFADSRTWVRVTVALAIIPIAVVMNSARVFGTGVAANYYGPEAAMSFFRAFSGWILLVAAFVILFLTTRMLLLVTPHRAPALQPVASGALRDTTRSTSVIRLIIVAACLLTGWGYLGHASRAESRPARESLARLPMTIDTWHGRDEPPFEKDELDLLGVDDYVLRSYFRESSLPVGLYAGYFYTQRQGDSIHSPLNCLPGVGWQLFERGRVTIDVHTTSSAGVSRPIEVNRIVIVNGTNKQLVLYWYQSHDRVVASEYWGKVYTVLDAVRYNRTDAALVRVIVPLPDGESAPAAETVAVSFVQSMFPLLGRHF